MLTPTQAKKYGGVPVFRGQQPPAYFFGWIPSEGSVEAHLTKKPICYFRDVPGRLAGSGVGKTVLLYEAARQVWQGRDLDPGPQKIGDCVSWGFGGCVDLLACLEALNGDEIYPYEYRICTEALYALSRVEYGDFDNSPLDGSYGSWASEAIRVGGTLPRHTLGPYDPIRAKQWGKTGLPDEYEPTARQHRVIETALVISYEEARDSIANGYPVAVCSAQGFNMERDDEGYAEPKGEWFHCMKFIASKDDERPGLLCMNSWGADGPDAHSGPKGKYDIPDGSFWVDAEICTSMLSSWRDSYSVSTFQGYPNQIASMARFTV